MHNNKQRMESTWAGVFMGHVGCHTLAGLSHIAIPWPPDWALHITVWGWPKLPQTLHLSQVLAELTTWCNSRYNAFSIFLFSPSSQLKKNRNHTWLFCLSVFWQESFSPLVLMTWNSILWICPNWVKRFWDSSFPPIIAFNVVHMRRGKHRQQHRCSAKSATIGRRPLTDKSHTKTELLITTHMLKCFIWTELNVIVQLRFLGCVSLFSERRQNLCPLNSGREEDRSPTVTCCL